MTPRWARKIVSCITAFSMAVALTVGVFSQSHAAVGAKAEETQAVDPCPDHMAVPVVDVSDDNCLTLCDSADLDDLTGILTDNTDVLDVSAVVTGYGFDATGTAFSKAGPAFVDARGPPGTALYLITQRLLL